LRKGTNKSFKIHLDGYSNDTTDGVYHYEITGASYSSFSGNLGFITTSSRKLRVRVAWGPGQGGGADAMYVIIGDIADQFYAPAWHVSYAMFYRASTALDGTEADFAQFDFRTSLSAFNTITTVPDKTPFANYYSSAIHAAGTTISIPQSVHKLRANRGLNIMVVDEATGVYEIPGIMIGSGGDVSIMFQSAVAANSKRVNIVG
jgi:hypothetical protein